MYMIVHLCVYIYVHRYDTIRMQSLKRPLQHVKYSGYLHVHIYVYVCVHIYMHICDIMHVCIYVTPCSCGNSTTQSNTPHTAIYCNTLQHTATHCNTLQHTATHCNTLQHATHSDPLHCHGSFAKDPCKKSAFPIHEQHFLLAKELFRKRAQQTILPLYKYFFLLPSSSSAKVL